MGKFFRLKGCALSFMSLIMMGVVFTANAQDELDNVAPFKPTVASGCITGHEAAKVNDGDETTVWAVSRTGTQYLQLDLERAYQIKELIFLPDLSGTYSNSNMADFSVWASNDQTFGNYDMLIAFTDPSLNAVFDSTVSNQNSYRYIRIVAGNTAQGDLAIGEMQIMAQSLPNVALWKSVIDSTDVPLQQQFWNWDGTKAPKAKYLTDGIIRDRNVWMPEPSLPGYAVIDLAARYDIQTVEVYHATTEYYKNTIPWYSDLANYTIEASNDPAFTTGVVTLAVGSTPYTRMGRCDHYDINAQTTQGRKFRYIKISTPQEYTYGHCVSELKVFAQEVNFTNAAYGRESSAWANNTYVGLTPGLAVDGDYNTDWFWSYGWHTLWQIDLGSRQRIWGTRAYTKHNYNAPALRQGICMFYDNVSMGTNDYELASTANHIFNYGTEYDQNQYQISFKGYFAAYTPNDANPYSFVRIQKPSVNTEVGWAETEVLTRPEVNINHFKIIDMNTDEEVSGMETGKTLGVKLCFEDNFNAGKSALLTVAFYDRNNVLQKVSIASGTASVNNDYTLNLSAGVQMSSSEDKYGAVRAFLWDTSRYAPYTDSIGTEKMKLTDLYVSPAGSDSSDGSETMPFQTIGRAMQEVEDGNNDMKNDINVILDNGVYNLDSPLTFGERDSGTNGYYVNYMAKSGASPVISGGVAVSGWSLWQNGIYTAQCSDISDLRVLYVNNREAIRARTENKVKGTGWYYDGQNVIQGINISKTILGNFQNPQDMEIHWSQSWRNSNVKVQNLIVGSGDCNTLVCGSFYGGSEFSYNKGFYLENALELLDTEGEFYFNKSTKTIYYKPYSDENMQTVQVYAPKLNKLVDIRSSNMNNKVKNITFNGLTFAYGAWDEPSVNGCSNLQANEFNNGNYFYPAPGKSFTPANIQLNGAENIKFINNTFKDLGCVGLGLYNGVKDCEITGNVFADISDSAITVGLPSHDAITTRTDGDDLAFGKAASASNSYDALHEPEAAVDYSPKSGWAGMGALVVDLGAQYTINKLELVTSQDFDSADTRCSFVVEGSNNPDFTNSVVLGQQGADALSFKATWSAEVNTNEQYRYIRARKTNYGFFYVADLHVINYSILYEPYEEVCKNDLISNNVITRVGTQFFGAPGIQAYYVDSLDIGNNYLYNLPYTGIGVGWGWNGTTESTTCRNNSIHNNRIENFLRECIDGGGIYTQGNQPGTQVYGNYISGAVNAEGLLYPDDGSAYISFNNNVLEDGIKYLHIWNSSIHNVTVSNSYTDGYASLNAGTNCGVTGTTVYLPGKRSSSAQSIVESAGLTPAYSGINNRVPANVRTTFGVQPYQNPMDYYDINDLFYRYVTLEKATVQSFFDRYKYSVTQFPPTEITRLYGEINDTPSNAGGLTPEQVIGHYTRLKNALIRFANSKY